MLDLSLRDDFFMVSEDMMNFSVCIETGDQEVDRPFIVSLIGVEDNATGEGT